MKIDYFSHNTRRSLQSTEQPEYGAHELLERIGIDLKNYQNGIAKVLAEHAKLISAAKVLDFGGGNGDLAVRFFNYSDIKPYVLEIDPKLRENCLRRGFEVCESFTEVPGSLDMIYSSNVLEHIEDDFGALLKLHDKLRVGGTLALYLPAFSCLWTAMDDRVGHYRRYSKKGLLSLLQKLGMTVDQCYYSDSIGFGLSLIYKLLPYRDGERSSRSLRCYDRWLFPISRKLDWLTSRYFGKNIFIIARRVS